MFVSNFICIRRSAEHQENLWSYKHCGDGKIHKLHLLNCATRHESKHGSVYFIDSNKAEAKESGQTPPTPITRSFWWLVEMSESQEAVKLEREALCLLHRGFNYREVSQASHHFTEPCSSGCFSSAGLTGTGWRMKTWQEETSPEKLMGCFNAGLGQ